MANEKNKTGLNKFDHLPIVVQLLIGLGLLLVVAAIGFAALYILDIFILDHDPIGPLITTITRRGS